MRKYYVVRPVGCDCRQGRDACACRGRYVIVARRPVLSWARPLVDRALPALVRRQAG